MVYYFDLPEFGRIRTRTCEESYERYIDKPEAFVVMPPMTRRNLCRDRGLCRRTCVPTFPLSRVKPSHVRTDSERALGPTPIDYSSTFRREDNEVR